VAYAREHLEPVDRSDGGGGLDGAPHRARVHRVERLGSEILSEMIGLSVTRLRQLRVGGTVDQLAPHRQGVSDQQQLHGAIDKQI
jgi:hypothetical protein